MEEINDLVIMAGTRMVPLSFFVRYIVNTH